MRKPITILAPLFYCYCAAAALDGVWQAGKEWWHLSPTQCVALSRTQAESDPDLGQYLLPGLAAKHSLLATFAWWHGTWAGIVPFWRPLTSLLLWLEYRGFSPDRFDRWFWVSAISHLAFTFLLAFFVQRLTGRPWLGALAALVFAGGAPISLIAWLDARLQDASLSIFGFGATPPCLIGFGAWKNQPEMWAGSLTLGAMTLALHRRWAGCLVCIATAVCVKESGWLAFPLTALVLWSQRRLGEIPTRILRAGAAVAVLLVTLRIASGWAVFYGYHYGQNHHWITRYEHAALGPYANELIEPNSRARALLGTLLATAVGTRRLPYRARIALLVIGTLFVTALSAHQLAVKADIAFIMLLTWGAGLEAVTASFVWLLGLTALWNSDFDRRVIVALCLMSLIAALPVAAAAQVQWHVLYLAFAFDSALIALTFASIFTYFGRMLSRRGPHRV